MKNGKNILIGILVVITITLSVMLYIFKNKVVTNKEENCNCENDIVEEKFSYKDFSGLYTYKGECNGEYTPIINIYFDENGLFLD